MGRSTAKIPDHYLFSACEKFIAKGLGAAKISDWLNEEFEDEGLNVTREQIYPLIKKGIALGFIKLCPPREMALTEQLRQKFWQAAADPQVLDVEGPGAVDHLTLAGAEKALSLIKELGKKKRTVHVGLGAGRTTERFSRNLAILLRSETQDDVPELVMHALSSGFLPTDPLTAPVAFFSYFRALKLNIRYMGMFSEPVVPWDRYEEVKKQPGVREAFAEVGKIDIVVSSLSSKEDEHGLFRKFLELGPDKGKKGMRALEKKNWVADVQWRPYSATEPIKAKTPVRPVTLFELDDLVRLSQTPDKHVILICGPCVECGETKVAALKPLMEELNLRVFNHLVTDVITARRLFD